MMRCGICMQWYHPTCTGNQEDTKYAKAAWSCSACRAMPATVSKLNADVSKILDMLSQCLKQSVSPHDDDNCDQAVLSTADDDDDEENYESDSDSGSIESVDASLSASDDKLLSASESARDTAEEDNADLNVVSDSALPSKQEAWMQQRRQKKRKYCKEQRASEESTKSSHSVTLIADSMP